MSRSPMAASLARLLIAASVALWLAAPGHAAAIHEPARLGLTPVGHDGTFFELSLEAGEARELQVEAANFGHEEAEARTYSADVYSIVNGGFGADLFGEEPTETTLWVSYPTQELTLGPDDAVVIDFRVEVPSDTPPGEYVTALVIENAEPVRGSGTIAVDQVNRSAIAIAIDVPGARQPALEIGAITHEVVTGFSVVSFEVSNPGNAHLRPAGEFVLRDGSGTEITRRTVAMDSVYAGTSTILEAPAPEPLRPGDYCAELSLSDEATAATATSSCMPFTVTEAVGEGPIDVPGIAPVVDAIGGLGLILPALLALLAAGITLLYVARRRRTREATAIATASPASGPAGGWPASDVPGPTQPTDEMLAGVLSTLRRVLREHPAIRRAWIVERDSAFVLAFEDGSGMSPADHADLAGTLQERVDREVGRFMPMLVVSHTGAGPVARTIADALPFYVRDVER